MGSGPHLSLSTAMDLVAGIDDGQLYLEYQPLVHLATGRVDAVEALVRWDHPTRGTLGPGQFLPQAQRSRLGSVITAFVLRTAAEQWVRWREAGLLLGIAVNVPPVELVDDAVPRQIDELACEGFDPTCLTIEVTERRIPDVVSIGPVLDALRRRGVRLRVDDFGTGDSSLVRIQELQFHEIKIDRSFVTHLGTPGTGREIVRFATELAHRLGMRVVAEGVEMATQLPLLAALDVDLVQGYHLGRPARAEALSGQLT